MNSLRNATPREVNARCQYCNKENTVEEWDKIGRRTWMSYSSLYNTVISGEPRNGMSFLCPSCEQIVYGSGIKISRIVRSNLEVASRLLRKED